MKLQQPGAEKADLLYLDGEWMPLNEGRVSVLDRGFNFGDGVYEVVRVYNGQPFTMREHLERQVSSARGLGFEIPLSIAAFADVLHELIERSAIEEALIYTQVTRGAALRNHVYKDDIEPTVMAFIYPAPALPETWREAGTMALPLPDIRWELCNLKTISLLPNIMAKNQAHRAGGAEALLYRSDGMVTEGSASNAYAVRDGEIWTAPLGPRILPGITRAQILEITQEIGMCVHEQALSLAEFGSADEVFMSGSNLELLPVTRLGDVTVGGGKPGPVYRQLHEAYRVRVGESCGITGMAIL